jgi:hypothetical protein
MALPPDTRGVSLHPLRRPVTRTVSALTAAGAAAAPHLRRVRDCLHAAADATAGPVGAVPAAASGIRANASRGPRRRGGCSRIPGVSAETAVPARRPGTGRVARVLTEVFAPAVLAAAMPLILAVHAADSVATGIGWGLLAALFSSAIPYGIIWLGVRRGSLTDHHIGVRQQRRGPALLGLASVLLGLAVLLVAGAPRLLVLAAVLMFVVLLVVAAVNQVWKLSAHAAAAAGAATALIVVFGPVLLATALVVVAVAWSRVRLGDHTTGQVLAGAGVGALLAGVIFGVFG